MALLTAHLWDLCVINVFMKAREPAKVLCGEQIPWPHDEMTQRISWAEGVLPNAQLSSQLSTA
jgi:hypothetical protein